MPKTSFYINLNKVNPETYPAMAAEWVYEPLEIQVAESHRSQVWIPLGAYYI